MIAHWHHCNKATFALYYLGAGVMLKHISSMRLAGLAGTASSLMVLIHYALTGDISQIPTLPTAVCIYAALMAVFSTVLPIYWVALAIPRLGTTQTAAVGNLGPVLTMLASWAILGEIISMYQILGLALVLLGVSRVKPNKPKQRIEASRASDGTGTYG